MGQGAREDRQAAGVAVRRGAAGPRRAGTSRQRRARTGSSAGACRRRRGGRRRGKTTCAFGVYARLTLAVAVGVAMIVLAVSVAMRSWTHRLPCGGRRGGRRRAVGSVWTWRHRAAVALIRALARSCCMGRGARRDRGPAAYRLREARRPSHPAAWVVFRRSNQTSATPVPTAPPAPRTLADSAKRFGPNLRHMKTFKNFIGGDWVPPIGGEYFENQNPADVSDAIGRFPAVGRGGRRPRGRVGAARFRGLASDAGARARRRASARRRLACRSERTRSPIS